jgi:hypothetical protein
MSDNTVEIKFGAQTGPLKEGTNQAAASVEGSVSRMNAAFADMAAKIKGHTASAIDSSSSMATGLKGHFETVGGAVGKLNGGLLAFAAVLAGGSFFKSAVDESKQFTSEAVKLSRALGITVDEASALNVALGDIYSSAETFIGASQMLTRNIRTNEQGIREMGVATRDSSGHLRPMQEIMMDSLKTLSNYKQGVDQNIAAQKLFGRGAAEASQLLKLNSAVIEEAKNKQQELGLTVGKENVEASKAYKAAMNDVGDVLLAVKKVIGDAVMPVLTRLGEWFSKLMPPAIFALKVAFSTLASVVIAVMGVLEALGEIIIGLAAPIMAFGRAIKALLSGDMTTATKEMQGMWSTWGDKMGEAFEKAKASASRSLADIKAQWGKPTAISAPTGGKTMGEEDPDKGKSRMGKWDAELTAAKVSYEKQNDLREMSKQQEMAYWEELKKRFKLTKEEMLSVGQKIDSLQLAMNKENIAEQIAAKKAEMESWKNNMVERLRISEEHYAIVVKRYGDESKEAKAAQAEIDRVKRQSAEQLKKAELDAMEMRRNMAMGDIEIEEQNAQALFQQGMISNAEMLTLEQQFEDARFAIKSAALDERMALLLSDPDANPAEIRKTLDQVIQVQQEHQAKLANIRNAAAAEDRKYDKAFADGVGNSFGNMISNVLSGTMKVRDAFRSMAQSVLSTFTGMIGKMAAEWMARKLLEKIISAKSAAGDIGMQAAKAGAGGVASMAAAPFPLNTQAPAFGAAMSALAGSYMGMLAPAASAEGGFDIPAGMNPVTQLHQREMVLPAQYADVIRGMGEGGGKAAAPNVTLQLHPDAMRYTLQDWLQGELARMAAQR